MSVNNWLLITQAVTWRMTPIIFIRRTSSFWRTWGWVLGKSAVTQLSYKYFTCYSVWSVVTVFAGTSYWSLSWVIWTQPTPSNTVFKIHFNIIFPIQAIIPKWSFTFTSIVTFLYKFLSLVWHIAWPFYSPWCENLKNTNWSICCGTPNCENFSCPLWIKVPYAPILFSNPTVWKPVSRL